MGFDGPRRIALALAVIGWAAACNEAVTDPSRDGFEADPRTIEGRWATLSFSGQMATRLDAELTPAGGVFLGHFDLSHNGRILQLFFSDGVWNGTILEFTASTPIGDRVRELQWTARYVPADDERPERLLLISNLFLTPIEYVRPQNLPQASR